MAGQFLNTSLFNVEQDHLNMYPGEDGGWRIAREPSTCKMSDPWDPASHQFVPDFSALSFPRFPAGMACTEPRTPDFQGSHHLQSGLLACGQGDVTDLTNRLQNNLLNNS